jgi:arsenite oxidase small subunit
LGATTQDPDHGLTRRGLLAAGALTAVAATLGAESADAQSAGYPRHRIVALSKLRTNRPVHFNYPLKAQSCVLVDLGDRVPGGVGPRRSIVAYSTLCQHMGCEVGYLRGTREFLCPCHQTRYDPARLGSIIQGVATRALPSVKLQVRGGSVYAVGVDGLVYGYRNNLTPGKKVGGTP